jgi:GxxExxY protein
MLRMTTTLPGELEDLVHLTIGFCITVHRTLGPGLRERVYQRAVCLELAANHIEFEREKYYPVTYRGHLLSHQSLDIVVRRELVLEIKSVEHLNPVHRAQVLTYLHVSKLPIGLLVNFNVAILQEGLKRVIL